MGELNSKHYGHPDRFNLLRLLDLLSQTFLSVTSSKKSNNVDD